MIGAAVILARPGRPDTPAISLFFNGLLRWTRSPDRGPLQSFRCGWGGAGDHMLQGWVVVAVALGYIGLLFVVASYGDRIRHLGRARLLIYPLSLAIYCTSWTFFGSVGLASRTGFDFLTIYVGPILMIGLGLPLILRVVRLAKAQNITSIADFIAARYGKGQAVAATVALIAILGTIPYIALQLKAVSASLEHHPRPHRNRWRPRAACVRRHRAVRCAVDGRLRRAVRHPPHRRHRASGRPDAGDRRGIDRQAGRLPGRRYLRDVLDVRRADRAVLAGDGAARYRGHTDPRTADLPPSPR